MIDPSALAISGLALYLNTSTGQKKYCTPTRVGIVLARDEMLTAGGPYYARLTDIDFEQARRNVDQHVWLPLPTWPATRPARCGPEERCCS